jgi:hypothetical protein
VEKITPRFFARGFSNNEEATAEVDELTIRLD